MLSRTSAWTTGSSPVVTSEGSSDSVKRNPVQTSPSVMPTHSRSKNGVASLPYIAGHPRLCFWQSEGKGVDGGTSPATSSTARSTPDCPPERSFMAEARMVT